MAFEIRQKVKGSIANSLAPLFENLTESGIQNIIKSRISRENFLNFLNKKIVEENTKDFEELLDFESTQGIYKNYSTSVKKYVYDLISVALYEEVLSFSEIKNLISANSATALQILEKIAVLEYGLYSLEGISLPTTTEFDKIYITDNVKTLYHSTKKFSAYKDLDNLNAELIGILGSTTIPTTSPTAFPSDFTATSFFRINERLAIIEKTNMSLYSFLLNYNTTSSVNDRSFLRKYYAVNGSGYYYKNNTKIYITGLNTLSYYKYLLATHNTSYETAHNFLITLWEKMLNGTINY
jgi:hypothetical protein